MPLKKTLSLFFLFMFTSFSIVLAGGEQEIEQVESLLSGFHKQLQAGDVDGLEELISNDFQITWHSDSGLVVGKDAGFLKQVKVNLELNSEMHIKIMEVYGKVGAAKVVFNGSKKQSTFFLNLVKEEDRWLVFSAALDQRKDPRPGR